MAKREPAWARPMCKDCGKRTAAPGSARCRECREHGSGRCATCARKEPVCMVCHCRKGLNFENCRACDLTVRIAIMRTRLRVQWLQLKGAIKEMFRG